MVKPDIDTETLIGYIQLLLLRSCIYIKSFNNIKGLFRFSQFLLLMHCLGIVIYCC